MSNRVTRCRQRTTAPGRAAVGGPRDRGHKLMDWRLAAAFVLLALIASCDLVAGVDELVPKERPPDPEPSCYEPADCGLPDECRVFVCLGGECVPNLAPVDTPCGGGELHCDAFGNCLCPAIGCPNDAPCDFHTDCASGYCAIDVCQDSPCGGPCPGGVCWECSQLTNTCVVVPLGQNPGGFCPGTCDGQGNCQSCANGTKDVNESAIDCGGPACPACPEGAGCDVPADCQSCRCEGGICVAPLCNNTVKDGCESDVDCGGPCGSTCAPGEQCNSKQDCASHHCADGICEEAR